jgi:hypothetical protein
MAITAYCIAHRLPPQRSVERNVPARRQSDA